MSPRAVVFITKIIWVAFSIAAAFMTTSPLQLCILSLLFLAVNAADGAVNIIIYKHRDLTDCVESAITHFYWLALLYGSGVMGSVIWYYVER